MSDFHFYCPWCRRRLVVDDSAAGSKLACPDCGKTIAIPPQPAWLPAINVALRRIVQDNLSGKAGNVRVRLRDAILATGYDPVTAGVEPGAPDDLLTVERLDRVLSANHVIALNYEQFIEDNQSSVVEEWPAWELIGHVRRNLPDYDVDAAIDWRDRWQHAAVDAGDEAAVRVFQNAGRMVARVDSDLWDALGKKWDDSLGNPFPPFVLGSGYGTAGIGRDEAIGLGLLEAATVVKPRLGIRPPALIRIEDKRITEYLWNKPAPCDHCGKDKPARLIHRCTVCEESICADCAPRGCSRRGTLR
jgi:hypothetical protein